MALLDEGFLIFIGDGLPPGDVVVKMVFKDRIPVCDLRDGEVEYGSHETNLQWQSAAYWGSEGWEEREKGKGRRVRVPVWI